MNAFGGDLDTVATDDIFGGEQSLYGVGVAGEPGGSSGGGSGGGSGSSEGKLSNLSVRARASSVGAFAPTSSREAILLRSVSAAPYTVQMTDRGGNVGEVLIEAHDADSLTASSRLTNLSTRTEIGGAAGILTAGFVINGSGSVTLLIRGVGPTLAEFGVTNVLIDPTLRVLNGTTAEEGRNDNSNSSDAAEKRSVADQVGAFALNEGSLDAALLITLNPGAYTVLVEGVGGAAGNGLVEIYEVSE